MIMDDSLRQTTKVTLLKQLPWTLVRMHLSFKGKPHLHSLLSQSEHLVIRDEGKHYTMALSIFEDTSGIDDAIEVGQEPALMDKCLMAIVKHTRGDQLAYDICQSDVAPSDQACTVVDVSLHLFFTITLEGVFTLGCLRLMIVDRS